MTSIPSSRGTPAAARTTRIVRRVDGSALTTPVAYIVGGIAVALAVLAVDAAVGEQAVPGWLRIGPTLARSSLVGLATSFVFVISVVFWVRVWAVQTTAQPTLPRVLSQFLTDPVQRHSMAFIIGAVAYVLVVVRAVPEDGAGMSTVPHLAVTLAYLIALAVAVTIVFVVDNAARWGRVGRLVRQIADQAVDHIRATHPPLGDGTSDGAGTADVAPQRPAGDPAVVLDAHDSGWVRSVDEGQLLGSLPRDSTIELRVRVGSFVLRDTQLVCIWTDRPEEVDTSELRDSLTLGTDPSFDNDIAYSIGELVDIVARSATAGSSDSTTTRGAAFHLGVVLRELVLRDLPPADRTDGCGRRLLRTQEPRLEDYFDAAFGPLRPLTKEAPGLADVLLLVIDRLEQQLREQLRGCNVAARHEMLQEHRQALHDVAPRGVERAGVVGGIGAQQPSEGVSPPPDAHERDHGRSAPVTGPSHRSG
jgi:uncharacterized membrane protein